MSRRRPRSAPPNGSLTFYQKQTALHKVKTLEKAMVSTMLIRLTHTTAETHNI